MFERLIREIEELQRLKKISVPIHCDQDGYIDKECPDPACLFLFKVHEEDWDTLFKDNQVFCPMCRHEAKSTSWYTTEQIKNGERQVIQHVRGRIDRAMEEDARNFNARQSCNSFITVSFKVTGTSPYHYILPISAKEEMLLKITCKACKARYAVIGSAFFCPACGHNCAEETFDQALRKIETKLKNLPAIRKAIEAESKDEAEITCRSLIETSVIECVVAFQRFCEVAYSNINPDEKVRFNAFQNLDTGGAYWKELYGEGYTDWISGDEYQKLNALFQQRHLLSHTEGIVDQKYIDKSGDTHYTVGQRIVVGESDVRSLTAILRKITDEIKHKVRRDRLAP
jgi:uncharacterized Zn finger protein (UPF0148 family)